MVASEADINSLAYVAGYTLKKVGQAVPLPPVMSRNPGIGRPFVDKYGAGLAMRTHAVVEGRKLPIPQIYIDWLERDGVDASPIRLARTRAGEHLEELRSRNRTGIYHEHARDVNAAHAAKLRSNKK